MVWCKQSWPEPGRLPDLGAAAGACVSQPDSWRWPAEVTPDWRVGTFPPGVCRWNDQAVVYTSSGLHWAHGAYCILFILNTDFSYVWYLYRRTLRQSYVSAVAYSGHFCFRGDLTKPSITIASVDWFYLNFVICLQLDIALLIKNSVKIWHCLSELWQCIQGVTFFVDTVYILCLDVVLDFLSSFAHMHDISVITTQYAAYTATLVIIILKTSNMWLAVRPEEV